MQQRDSERRDRLAEQGVRFATALLDGVAGRPGTYEGWRGALQMAADITGQDGQLLDVADDVYANCLALTNPIALRRFASCWHRCADRPETAAFLEGIVRIAARRVASGCGADTSSSA